MSGEWFSDADKRRNVEIRNAVFFYAFLCYDKTNNAICTDFQQQLGYLHKTNKKPLRMLLLYW